MHLMNVMVKGKLLNILLPVLSLLRAETAVASSQKAFSNFTVTRIPGLVDSFTFEAFKSGNTNCSLKSPDICATYGGIPQKTKCETKELCCEVCQCVKERPTFLVDKQRCLQDKNITKKSGTGTSGYRFNLQFPDSSCQSQSLATLNTTAPGRRNFSICNLSNIKRILRCTMSPKESKYLDHNGQWVVLGPDKRRAVKHGFSLGVLQLKWQRITETLQGSIIMLEVTCFEEFFTSMGMKELEIPSRLLFKIAGSEIWQGSNVFQEFNIMNPTNKSGGLVVMPTTNTVSTATEVESSTPGDKERLNVIHVSGKVDMILVVVAAVLGTLLFIAVIFGCIGVGFIVMKKKKKVPLGANNPLYERGPDLTLIENRGSRQTFPFNSHVYQPLVENTREAQGNRGEPIYQSLDEQVRVSRTLITEYEENPNRCSLAYCDMTTDGYLIPTDGHILPEPPTTPVSREDLTEDSYIDVLPDKSPTQNKSLNYEYNKPEEIISDHSPTMSLREFPSDQESDHEELNYDDVKVVPPQTRKELENSTQGKDSGCQGKEHCGMCKGTIGNYGIGEDSKPVKCLCDVTTKL